MNATQKDRYRRSVLYDVLDASTKIIHSNDALTGSVGVRRSRRRATILENGNSFGPVVRWSKRGIRGQRAVCRLIRILETRGSRNLGKKKHEQGWREATKAATKFESCASCLSEQPGDGPSDGPRQAAPRKGLGDLEADLGGDACTNKEGRHAVATKKKKK